MISVLRFNTPATLKDLPSTYWEYSQLLNRTLKYACCCLDFGHSNFAIGPCHHADDPAGNPTLGLSVVLVDDYQGSDLQIGRCSLPLGFALKAVDVFL